MDYRITGLAPAPFRHLAALDDGELARRGMRRIAVDACPGFPDRIEMRDAAIGETVLLLNHVSQPTGPYRASHAIFVREGATERYDRINEIPSVMTARLLSMRSFSADGMMLEADVVEGSEAEALIQRLFSNPDGSTIHVHNARQGCYSGLIERA